MAYFFIDGEVAVDAMVNKIVSDDDPPVHDRVHILELKPHHCRWPCGDVGTASFGFCGRPKRKGAYCRPHANRAYVKPQQKHRLSPGFKFG